LDEVLNCEIKLLLRNQPVSPLLFQVYDFVRECPLSEIDCFSEGISIYVRLKSPFMDAHLLEEVSSFLMHARSNKLASNFFKLIMRNTNLIS
jgi:hypothetical protein